MKKKTLTGGIHPSFHSSISSHRLPKSVKSFKSSIAPKNLGTDRLQTNKQTAKPLKSIQIPAPHVYMYDIRSTNSLSAVFEKLTQDASDYLLDEFSTTAWVDCPVSRLRGQKKCKYNIGISNAGLLDEFSTTAWVGCPISRLRCQK